MAPTTTAKTRRRAPTRPSPRPPVTPSPEGPATVGELLKRLGGVPARRVRMHPTPGTATEKDLIKALDAKMGLCELVDGTLVEKPMGYEESRIAATIIILLGTFVRRRRLGLVTGESGPMKLLGDLVRMPDVAFVSWDRLPGRKRPKAPIPLLVPDLAVEVLSRSNTRSEIRRKVEEYFRAGVRLVWLVDPRKRTVRVHTSVEPSVVLEEGQVLDGGEVLPGFALPVAEIFAEDRP